MKEAQNISFFLCDGLNVNHYITLPYSNTILSFIFYLWSTHILLTNSQKTISKKHAEWALFKFTDITWIPHFQKIFIFILMDHIIESCSQCCFQIFIKLFLLKNVHLLLMLLSMVYCTFIFFIFKFTNSYIRARKIKLISHCAIRSYCNMLLHIFTYNQMYYEFII